MSNKVRFFVFVFAAFGFAAAAFVFSDSLFTSIAGRPVYWITVDESELNHVQTAVRQKGGDFNFEIIERRGGLAIIKSDELQIFQLTENMHEEFHKCAGFTSHESYEEASRAIDGDLQADRNLVAVDYTINNQTNVNQLLPEANETNIRNTIINLSSFPNRCYNQQTGVDSANAIKNQWTQIAAGRSDISVEFFNHPVSTSLQPSIILTIQGTTMPSEVVVLGGHQDSILSPGGCTSTTVAPGADDDASGIASLTETLRVMVAKNFRPQRTVKFMAYAAEEVGLRGSNAIAQDYQTRGVNVVGVLQLDMTNYKSVNSTIDIALVTDRTNAAQNQFLRDLMAAYLPTLTHGNTVCNYGCSDHSSWNSRGFAASFPHESALNNSSPFIHKTTDTLSQSGNNANHALKFTKLALTYVGELAKGSIQTNAPTAAARMDFDGDGRTDVSVFRPENGVWYLNRSQAGFTASAFGTATDKIVPADFDGDGKTDVAVYRNGDWYIMQSSDNQFRAAAFGSAGDIPQAADFDGDGKADFAVFRPSNGTWYILKSQDGFFAQHFGIETDRPVAADFDGDGKADVAVYRGGNWYIQQSQDGFKAVNFGLASDLPITGDFDGDAKADISVYRDGIWHQLKSGSGYGAVSFGLATDKPVFGDYDGDGKDDAAVFRPENGVWYILKSSDSGFLFEGFGLSSDIPTPAAFSN